MRREKRLARLKEFWKRMEQAPVWTLRDGVPGFDDKLAYWSTVTHGIAGFFKPNPPAHAGDAYPLGADHAGYYSTAPLEKTLRELVDFDLANRGTPRLTVGAAHVRTSQMRYFDSRDCELTVKHVMASGALPPAFPAVRIDGELYWDGGILSNTPTEAVFDDNPRRNSLIFSVHLWNPPGAEPTTMAEVLNRHKDVQYSSRIASQIARQQQAHRLRHVINQLAARLPESERDDPAVRDLIGYGCPTRMHVVRLARTAARSRDPHQGHRLQPGRHHAALGRRLCAYEVGAGARAVDRRIRSAVGRGAARAYRRDAVGRGIAPQAVVCFIELPQALRIVGFLSAIDEALQVANGNDLELALDQVRAHAAGPVPGLFGPDTVTWRIDREAVIFLGAGRALLLQLAHPWVAAAIAEHSKTFADPIGRFHRTFDIVFAMVFGSLDRAMLSSRQLHRRHSMIVGEMPRDYRPLRGRLALLRQ